MSYAIFAKSQTTSYLEGIIISGGSKCNLCMFYNIYSPLNIATLIASFMQEEFVSWVLLAFIAENSYNSSIDFLVFKALINLSIQPWAINTNLTVNSSSIFHKNDLKKNFN